MKNEHGARMTTTLAASFRPQCLLEERQWALPSPPPPFTDREALQIWLAGLLLDFLNAKFGGQELGNLRDESLLLLGQLNSRVLEPLGVRCLAAEDLHAHLRGLECDAWISWPVQLHGRQSLEVHFVVAVSPPH